MAQTPEGKVKNKVKRLLNKYNCYYFMPVQMGYGVSTLDFLCCHRGLFFAIETKAPGKKPTPRQEIVIDEMRSKKAAVFVIDGVEDYKFIALENFLLDADAWKAIL